MTLQEASKRWNVTADALKQNCRGRVKNGLKPGEYRKSGKNWLVTRQAMERLYGEEIKMLKVINCTSNQHREMGTVESYKEAWELILEREMRQSPCIGKWDKAQWEECNMQDEFPDFKWPEGVDYVWTADWIAEVILDPKEYNEEGVRGLIDDLMLSYKIEEIAD
jgi:hypothetical protein